MKRSFIFLANSATKKPFGPRASCIAHRTAFGLCVVGLLLFAAPTLHGESATDPASSTMAETKQSSAPEILATNDKPAESSETKTIRGQVVNQQGKPVAGAQVLYWYLFDKKTSKESGVETQSDANGRFTLEISLDQKNNLSRFPSVWVYSLGYSLGNGFPGNPSSKKDFSELRIELAPASDTSLVVLDPQGRPVADALVEPMHYRARPGYDVIPEGVRRLVQARTDAEGRAKLPAMAREHWVSVWVTTNDYGLQTQRLTPKPSEPTERAIHLRPVSRIEGRVTADNPEWVRGIRIIFTTEKAWEAGRRPGHQPPWPTEGHADVVTDHEGRYVVPKIAEGQLSMVQTVLDENLPVRPVLPPPSVRLLESDTTELDLPMCRLVDIHGSIIVKDTGEPLSGIKINVHYGNYRQGTDVVSDANGRFTARVLPGLVNYYLLNLSNTKYLQFGRPQPYEALEDEDENEMPPIEVMLSEPLDGRLIDENDQPVADATVIAYHSDSLCSSARTKKNGQFTLPKMPVGNKANRATYRVIFDPEGRRFMNKGEVEIVEASPLVIRVTR